MCAQIANEAQLRATLDALADAAGQAEFRLASDSAPMRRERRDDLIWSIREYLVPRLGDLDGPVVAVLIGSTGAGKSTLLNSIAQAKVSDPGAIRPTTRRPTVWCHERHAHRYDDSFLTGYTAHEGAEKSMRVVSGSDQLLESLTLVDAPDFDSVEELHREIADELLAIADVCIFVTSAQRYADAVPWEFLAKAKDRNVPILFVVNRMGRRGSKEILDDYRGRLDAGGIHVVAEDIVTIGEQSISSSYAGVSKRSVRPLLKRLSRMTESKDKSAVIAQAVIGGVIDVGRKADLVASDIDEEALELEQLHAIVTASYGDQMLELTEALEQGTLIRGEVVKRWQSFVGTGEILKAMTTGAGRLRSWARTVFGGAAEAEAIVGREATAELVVAVTRRCDTASRATAAAWELTSAGRDLLSGGDLWRRDDETEGRAEQALAMWMASLSALIEEQGDGRKKLAKAASVGINAAAVSLLLVVFAQTGGLTGGEFGIAAGAAAAQQGLLEHIFGSAAAKSLAEKARVGLEHEIERVLAADAARFFKAIEGIASGDGSAVRSLSVDATAQVEEWHGS